MALLETEFKFLQSYFIQNDCAISSQLILACSKLTRETLEQDVKYVQSYQ